MRTYKDFSKANQKLQCQMRATTAFFKVTPSKKGNHKIVPTTSKKFLSLFFPIRKYDYCLFNLYLKQTSHIGIFFRKCLSPIQNSGTSGSGSAGNLSSVSNPNVESGTTSNTNTSNYSYKPPHLTELLLSKY